MIRANVQTGAFARSRFGSVTYTQQAGDPNITVAMAHMGNDFFEVGYALDDPYDFLYFMAERDGEVVIHIGFRADEMADLSYVTQACVYRRSGIQETAMTDGPDYDPFEPFEGPDGLTYEPLSAVEASNTRLSAGTFGPLPDATEQRFFLRIQRHDGDVTIDDVIKLTIAEMQGIGWLASSILMEHLDKVETARQYHYGVGQLAIDNAPLEARMQPVEAGAGAVSISANIFGPEHAEEAAPGQTATQ